jgi:hypothetical protein
MCNEHDGVAHRQVARATGGCALKLAESTDKERAMRAPIEMEPLADEGFYQTIEPEAARRQFNMSLGLVAALSLVAVLVGLTAGFGPVDATVAGNREARITVQTPQRVQIMQAQGYQSQGG